MDILVVIPARGGSKGLPRKNVLPIGGKSLVGRAVEVARAAKHAPRVVVSTDDAEIANAGRLAGADIVDRPAEISGDKASSESALFHALDHLAATEGYKPELVLLVQCTSPFIVPEEVDGAIDAVLDQGNDAAFVAVPFHHFLWKQRDGTAVGVNHAGGPRQRRQDLEPEYLEAGSVYCMRVEPFRREGHRFCGKVGMFIGDPANAFEIDARLELEMARRIWPLMAVRENVRKLPRTLSCIVFDFDGVMTDNRVLTTDTGSEAVFCSRGDGMGIEQLRKRGVPMLVLSKEQNPVVAARCRKMQMPCIQGIENKRERLDAWLKSEGHDPAGLVYVGNDINDAECLDFAACAVGPSDSHADIVPLLDIQLEAPGGNGAVRELADMLVAALSDGRVTLGTQRK